MIFTAFITTVGMILITEYAGKRYANYVKKFLGFLLIWPFLFIALRLLFLMLIDLDNAGAASSAASDEMLSMLPEFIASAYIGEAAGFVIWGIYRRVKRLRKRYF